MTVWIEDNDLEELLLQRYCSDTASAEEATRIEAWFREHQDQRVWYEQFKTVLRKQDYPLVSEEHLDAKLAEFLRSALQQHSAYDGEQANPAPLGPSTAHLAHQSYPEYSAQGLGTGPQTLRTARQKEGVSSGQPPRWALWFTAAAAVVLGSAVVLVGWNAGMHPLGRHSVPSMVTYTTGNGERATITLPDGGTVALNVASRLDVPMDYMAGNHTVRLVGEGLFTVLHHAGTPLTVRGGPTTARVLGTSFLVRRYGPDTTTLVAVRDGKVVVDAATVVTANQLVEVNRPGVSHVRPSDPSQFSFATGILTIDGLPLPAAIVELDRWFDADIRLGDPTLAKRFLKGKYAAGSLGDLAEILELTFDGRVVRDGRVLTLFPKR